jgi:lipopolysaccharide/colanic/teichoic acid biosynthesis glycosyltransferase
MLKRSFDFLCSLLGLIVLIPFLVVLGILVKLDSRGPTFYRGSRAGLWGKPFRIVKFRTMVTNADQIGGPSTSADDPRITRVGAVLRRFKLDELPQLLNVLLGDMSLVGPRPEVLSETLDYTPEERRLFEVRPGITDWASIRFRNEAEILRGSSDPHRTYCELIRPEKMRLALAYVDHHSMRNDLGILLETLRVLLMPGAKFRLPPRVAEKLRFYECIQSEPR